MNRLLMTVLVLGMASCGERQSVKHRETIVCSTDYVCRGETLTCTRKGYYSQEWECTLFGKGE